MPVALAVLRACDADWRVLAFPMSLLSTATGSSSSSSSTAVVVFPIVVTSLPWLVYSVAQTELMSALGEAGRAMELSDLLYYNGHLYTFDDRTGVGRDQS